MGIEGKVSEHRESSPEGQNLCIVAGPLDTAKPISGFLAWLPFLLGDPRLTCSPGAKVFFTLQTPGSRLCSRTQPGGWGVGKREACPRNTVFLRHLLYSYSGLLQWQSFLFLSPLFSVRSTSTQANLGGKSQSLNDANCFKNFLIRSWILLISL